MRYAVCARSIDILVVRVVVSKPKYGATTVCSCSKNDILQSTLGGRSTLQDVSSENLAPGDWLDNEESNSTGEFRDIGGGRSIRAYCTCRRVCIVPRAD